MIDAFLVTPTKDQKSTLVVFGVLQTYVLCSHAEKHKTKRLSLFLFYLSDTFEHSLFDAFLLSLQPICLVLFNSEIINVVFRAIMRL